MDEDLKKSIKTLGYVSSIGIAMAISIVLGAFIGYYIDQWLGTQPVFTLVFLALGIAAAFKNLYTLYKKMKEME